MSEHSKTDMYRKQSETFENYARATRLYYSAILAFHIFYSVHNREFILRFKGQ